MKKRQLLLLLILLVALGGAALIIYRRNSAVWRNTATTANSKVLQFALNDVSRVRIKANSTEVNLARENDVWTVRERSDYPADFEKISAVVRKLWELRPVQQLKVGPSQMGRLQLEAPGPLPTGGTLLELKDANTRPLAALLVGKKLGDNPNLPPNSGRYVKVMGGPDTVYGVAELFDEVDSKPVSWLDHDFIRVEEPRSITVTGVTRAMHWSLRRETLGADWQLAEARSDEEFNGTVAARITALLAKLSFADVLGPSSRVAETGLDKPSLVRIETFDGLIYELRIGKTMGENDPVQIAVTGELVKVRTPGAGETPVEKARLDFQFEEREARLAKKLNREQKLGGWIFLIPKNTVDSLLPNRDALLVPKKNIPAPPLSVSPNSPDRALPRTSPVPHSAEQPAKP